MHPSARRLLSILAMFGLLIGSHSVERAWAQQDTVQVIDRGCFLDNPNAAATKAAGHDLDGAVTTDAAMTVSKCLSRCYDMGFKHAGLQAGSRCYCGNSYGRFGTDGAVCQSPCSGDPSQVCGGATANRVYEFTQISSGLQSSPQTGQQSQTQTQTAQQPAQPDHVQRTAIIWPVGKWPEGITWDGRNLWLAESGSRQIAQLDPQTGRVIKRTRVGRLPVDVAAAQDGTIYAMVATDKTVWQSNAKNGQILARLDDHPQAMGVGRNDVWVLMWIDGGSDRTQLVRHGRTSGTHSKSEVLPQNGFDLAVLGNTVWTLHRHDNENRSEAIALSGATLRIKTRASIEGFVTRLAASDERLFAAGGNYGESGLIVKLDPRTGNVVTRIKSARFVSALTVLGDHVVAVDDQGGIAIFAASDLSLRRTISSNSGVFSPQDILATKDGIFITTHRGSDGNGSIIYISDWRP
jgi:outer membrane protein assembly factor BamB